MNVEVDILKPSKGNKLPERDADVSLSLDAFIRSIGVRKTAPIAFFLGAGASTTSGIPSAQMCVWEWKRRIFLTNNPGLEEQFTELSLVEVKRRIQRWLDRQAGFPKEGAAEEYGFYIQQCFPIEDDRHSYFQEIVRNASPHAGYKLLCQLAEAELVRSVWSPNFDGLTARTAGSYKLSPIEVGIDTQHHLRAVKKGEVLCVSMHGDYRYDKLMNTPAELQQQEEALRHALAAEVKDTPLIVSGYSGRDASLMEALKEGYSHSGGGVLYWCGIHDDQPSPEVDALIRHARSNGRQAYYVSTFGFDDLLTRLGLHILEGEARKGAEKALELFVTSDKITRTAWQVRKYKASTLIKSNAFAIECPSEMLCFDLKAWPEKAWSGLRSITEGRDIVAVPLRGKVCALGRIDDIKDAFKDNIKGTIERTPVAPSELAYEDGAITSLMREALTRIMAQSAELSTDGRNDLWQKTPRTDQSKCKTGTLAYDSVQLYLRRLGNVQYLTLMPSIKVLDRHGVEVPLDVANFIKLAILGYQHNKPFNQAVMHWRETLLPDKPDTTYEFPLNCGSTFRFKIKRSPVFGEIGLPGGGKPTQIPDKMRHLVKYDGIELKEPELVFSNRAGTGLVRSPHPIRGIVDNRPFDFPLTAKGFFSGLRVGIVCAGDEAQSLRGYLQNAHRTLQPSNTERDYLVDYPGFQQAFGVPVEFPEPGSAGWFVCPEPNSSDAHISTLEIAGHINRGIEQLQSAYAPHVVLVFYPTRWNGYRGYRTESERFDVHDFVKAFCVQRGIATQFLNQDTFADGQQCRVWWWLSLALYVKAMRTPWVLNSLAENTAFVGLGFSIDPFAERGKHVVLGCSHIYSGKGEGLQYRLSKIEDPIIYGKNAFMSKEDARRTGETIRQLFFDARLKLPERVVLHKRTHFTTKEREGLAEGLSGVRHLDMLEIQIDNALRYVASVPTSEGSFDDDNFPVRRGTAMKLDDFTALLWVHGATTALHPRFKYFQGKRRIPAPLTIRRHAGHTDLQNISEEILGLSKMNWNTFDLYTKLPATIHSSNQIARIGSLLQRFGTSSYDYRLFI
jgi:hypothetical protein